MTLDAGGTNMVFSASQGAEEIVDPVVLPSVTDNLEKCLELIKYGFENVCGQLDVRPQAISFAFPGPADYESGIIGDLPNFPAFRGGVPLGPFLESHFGIPVFINNDGNLFAYGEALAGVLPEINSLLQFSGSTKRYRNLLGVTLGTGFGGGIVIDGEMLRGDNQAAASLWRMPNKLHPGMIAEESVSIRAVQRVYSEMTGDTAPYSPKDIFDIAEGRRAGSPPAAKAAFAELGEVVGDTIASAMTLTDGLVVIGGGMSGAYKYILPALMKELHSDTGKMDGTRFDRLVSRPFNLEDPAEMAEFLKGSSVMLKVPGTDRMVEYRTDGRVGIKLSRLGASRAIALGAYWFAVREMEKRNMI